MDDAATEGRTLPEMIDAMRGRRARLAQTLAEIRAAFGARVGKP